MKENVVSKKKIGSKQGRAGRKWALLTAKEMKRARDAANMSRKELADAIGVSSGAIQGWEFERGTPSLEVQERLCAALKLTPSELPQPEPAAEPAASQPQESAKPAPARRREERVMSVEGKPEPSQRDYAVASIVSAMVHKGLLSSKSDVYEAIPRVAGTLH